MAKKYYGLFSYTEGQWAYEFGDYDKECVEFERDDYMDKGWKRKHLIIHTWNTCPSQGEIDQLQSAMNTATRGL